MWAGAAPVLIAVLANTKTDKGDKNNHAWYDTGQAVANISGQATSMGLVMHQMSGFDPGVISNSFALAEGLEPVSIIALGYEGKLDSLPEMIQKMEVNKIRERKPLVDIVFYSM
jgi:hypothetical protein